MKAILSADKNWGIGCNNQLLERVPEDMRFFKATTIGGIVVMGRETFYSLPGRKPLVDRTNIVLTRKLKHDAPEGIILCGSLEELLVKLKDYPSDSVYIIGGASVYKLMLPYCSEVLVTRFPNIHEADTFFPDLDKEESWIKETLDSRLQWNDLVYDRYKYINKRVQAP